MDNDIDKKTELTYEQLFQLIKNSGYLGPNSVMFNVGLNVPFNEDGFSNVDISSSG